MNEQELPLIVEEAGTSAKTPKRRTVKPKATPAKAATTKAATTKAAPAKATAAKVTVKAPESDTPKAVEKEAAKPAKAASPKAAKAAPAARKTTKITKTTKAKSLEEPAAPAPSPAVEIAAPSGTKRAPQPAAPAAAPTPAPSPAPVISAAPETPASAPVAPRQYPVYIPRHVAKQLEESGQPAPIAVTAEIAASMPIIAAAATTHLTPAQPQERQEHQQPRQDRPDHRQGGRHDRNDRRGQRNDRRGGRHDDRRNDDRRQQEPTFNDAPQETLTTAPSPEDELGIGEGIVEISGKGFGFLRDPKKGYTQNPSDIFVTPEIARNFNLRDGQWIKGHIRRGNRGPQLYKLLEVNGQDPELSREQPAFDELTVVSPLEKFTLETVPDRHTTRIIDLFAPIGKGQRGIIVAPPRTGKTTLLQHIADSIVKNHPETKLIILLVDERPEEVTDIKRTVPTAEIMASSNDMDIKSHTRIAQLAIERAKRLVEAGQDVFILLDSITRVGRAFNNAMSGGGRTMSGGVDARALEIPRRIFAAARNTEEAGSITIVATALIDTGSRMDDLIFQEFKGTGNMELVLDRKISDQRIYPAIDIFLSGTRREELLIPADDLHKIGVIRRGLSGYKPIEAIERLIFFMKKFPTNTEMLKNIPG